jgi:hypothetical protein
VNVHGHEHIHVHVHVARKAACKHTREADVGFAVGQIQIYILWRKDLE